MEDSVFTKIIKGDIPADKVYEDAKNLAFLDIDPDTVGHILVVPKAQVDKFYELTDDDYQSLMAAAKLIATAMDHAFGTRTLLRIIGTDVPHTHIHLTPYDPTWTHGRKITQTPEERAATAEKIRAAIAAK